MDLLVFCNCRIRIKNFRGFFFFSPSPNYYTWFCWNILSNLNFDFMNFPFFSFRFLTLLCSKNILYMIWSLSNLLLFYAVTFGVSWRMFSIHLRKLWFLLLEYVRDGFDSSWFIVFTLCFSCWSSVSLSFSLLKLWYWCFQLLLWNTYLSYQLSVFISYILVCF